MNIPGWFCFGQIGADKENNVPPKPKESFYKNYKFPWIVKRSYQLRLEEDRTIYFIGSPTENFVQITFVDRQSKEWMKVKNS
jgi:hypothetical protein